MEPKKKKYYITFGQDHLHQVGDQFLNKDCVAEFTVDDYKQGRERAWTLFGDQFAFDYSEDNLPDMSYFPRGIIQIP